MLSSQAAEDVLAQNLANASTNGYKQDVPRFQAFSEVLLQRTSESTPGTTIGRLGQGGEIKELVTDFSDGSLQATGNPLDVALTGNAYLTVRTPQGTLYSRDGSLARNAQGLLVQSSGGALVLGKNGQPIKLPVTAKKITITTSGEIQADGTLVGQLRLVGVDHATSPVKVGANLYAQSAAGPIDPTATVRQGFLESSNVSVVKEMVTMISVMRSFETNQKMVQSEDNLTDKAVNEVAKAQ